MSENRKKLLISCRSQRRKTRWATDFDYLSQLSNDELSFLAEFCQLHYHGSPHRCIKHIVVSDEMRLESYELNNKRQADIFNNLNMCDTLEFDSRNKNMLEDTVIEIINIKIKRG